MTLDNRSAAPRDAVLTGAVAIGIGGRTPAAAPAVLGSPVTLESPAATGAAGSPGPEGPPVRPGLDATWEDLP